MVFVLPNKDVGFNIGKAIGEGATSAYMHRADEKALQKIVGGLDPNASPQDILKAITSASTYSDESKQKVLKNLFTAEEMKEKKRASLADESIKLNKTMEDEVNKVKQKKALVDSGLLTEKEAEQYLNLNTGAQTEYFKNRQEKVSRLSQPPFSEFQQELAAEQPSQEASQPQAQQPQVATGEQKVSPPKPMNPAEAVGRNDNKKNFDPDFGLTPKERVKRQDDRYKVQTPMYEKYREKLAGYESEGRSINLLNELNPSPNISTGLAKLNINPVTGQLSFPALATAEEQLFVKTVNDFTVKAKDSFGARVTNFELDRFMQRLPTLANSKEGREMILRQMDIINQINQLETKGVIDVLDEYGIRNIDFSDAEKRARNKSKDEISRLTKEYTQIESLVKKDDSAMVNKAKKEAPEGYDVWRTPEGKLKYFPKKNAEGLKTKGYQKL